MRELLARPGVQGGLYLVFAALLLFARVGESHLSNYDDCYYAEKAKEMVTSGDWLTPHYAGHPRFDNAPLFLWLMAIAFRAFGVTNYAAVFFSALSGVFSVYLLFRLAPRLGLTPFGSWVSGFVLLTTGYFTKYARHAMFDVFLTFLFLVALTAYRNAWDGRRRHYLLLGLAAGLGVLTKSVLGLFPLAVALLHLAACGRARAWLDPWLWAGLAVCALIVAPWYGIEIARFGDAFFEEHVRWLLWKRAFVSGAGGETWAGRLGYVTGLFRNGWPWLPLSAAGLFLAARRAFARPPRAPAAAPLPASPGWTERETGRLALLWILVVVGTMSLAHEKKLWYVMSVFPCLALCAGLAAERWIRSEPARGRTIRVGTVLLGLAAVAVNALPIPLGTAPRADLHQIALVARATAPPGRKVLNLDANYWSVNNLFLFYSDRDLTDPLADPALVRQGLAHGDFALLLAERYPDVAGVRPEAYPVVARSGQWLLVRGAVGGPAVLPERDPFR